MRVFPDSRFFAEDGFSRLAECISHAVSLWRFVDLAVNSVQWIHSLSLTMEVIDLTESDDETNEKEAGSPMYVLSIVLVTLTVNGKNYEVV